MRTFFFISAIILSFSANAQNVNIPDTNFKSALLHHNPVIDINGDGEIQVIEAAAFNGFIQVSGMGISDLTGIEAFTDLDSLFCSYNQLTSVNIGSNVVLKKLDISSNHLTNLDISNNIALTSLNVNNNMLISLNVDNHTALSSLVCYRNQLTSLNVSNNTALINLHCDDNPILSLDISNNTALTTLNCSDNQLTTLDLGNNSALTSLNCSSNQLQNLDVSNNTALISLYCVNNQLTSLDVNNNTALKSLILHENQLTNLDVSNNTALERLDCSRNLLTNLDVSNNLALTQLDCYTNQLSDVDVSNNIALTIFSCSSNQLTDLDVSNNIALTSLFCSNNQLTNLDVSNNTALISFSCLHNLLISVNIANGNNTNLIDFRTIYNPDLMCIQVDDVVYSITNWTGTNFRFDADVTFSEDCGSITAPTILTVTMSVSPLFITLNWTDNATGETGYKLERSTDGSNFSEIESLAANSTTTTDNNVIASTTYYYRIYAYNTIGNLGFSNVVQITTGTTGSKEINNDITGVYPNPANSILNIETKENSNIKIVTPLGTIVAVHQLYTGNNIIDISGLTKGIYFVDNGKGGVLRFVKE